MEMMGAPLKKREKVFVLRVAEEMMILSSGRRRAICLRRPRMKSMFRLRSWASSTMMTL